MMASLWSSSLIASSLAQQAVPSQPRKGRHLECSGIQPNRLCMRLTQPQSRFGLSDAHCLTSNKFVCFLNVLLFLLLDIAFSRKSLVVDVSVSVEAGNDVLVSLCTSPFSALSSLFDRVHISTHTRRPSCVDTVQI